MNRTTIHKDGTASTEEAVPECGDYCDNCGDCLHCSHEDDCYNGGHHAWVVYE